MNEKIFTAALFFLLLSLTARSQDSLFLAGPSELCMEQCDSLVIIGQVAPNWTYQWDFQNGQVILTEDPATEVCGYFFGADGVYTVSVDIIEGDIIIATLETFIFVNNLFLPPITSSSNCGPPPGTQPNCDRTCAHSTVTYSLDFPLNADVIWQVTGAESFEVQPNGQSVTVTWGEAGNGTVEVIAFSGFCTGTTSLCVNILNDPKADFTTSPPASGDVLTICQGQTVQFQNTSQYASSYEWTFGNGETSTEENPETNYPSPGNYEVMLVAYNDCLCADTTTLTVEVQDAESPFVDCVSTICENTTQTYSSDATCGTFSWTVSANGDILDGGGPADNFVTVDWGAGPTGTIELQVSDCSGGDFCLAPTLVEVPILSENALIEGPERVCRGETATYTLPPYEATEFTWTVSNLGAIVGGQGTNEVTIEWADFVTATPQWIAVTYDNCWLGCGGGDTLTVNLRPRFFAEGPIEVCPGASENYTARNGENLNPASANWTLILPDGTSIALGASAATQTVDWPDTPGFYQLIAEPAQPTDFCQERFELTVRIPEALPPVDAVEGAGAVCPGESYSYRALTGETNTRFEWTITNGASVTTKLGNPIVVTWGNTPPYELSVVQIPTTGLACPSAPLDTVLTALPPFTISGPADVCQEDTDLFTTAFDPAVTYDWRITPAGAGTIIRADDNEVEVLWRRPGPAAVELDACGQSVSFAVNILPKPRPLVSHPDEICPNETAAVSTAAAYNDYTWRDEDGNVVSTQPGPDLGPGYYELIVVDANGCTGDTTFYIGGFPASIISISTPDNTGYCLADNPAPRTLYAVNTDAGYTYQWLQDGNPIPGATGPTYSTLAFGDYRVRITDQNGCSFESNTITLFEICGFSGGVCNGTTCTFPPECDPGTNIQFDIQPTPVCNLRQYNNQSLNFIPGTLQWNFDDPASGADNISSLDSPSHLYSKAGFYTVILIGEAIEGGDTLFCWDARVDTVFAAAAFDYDGVCPGGEVQFNDLSTHLPFTSITNWAWDFGDPASGAANTSTDPNPTHSFAAPGDYTVSLTITSSEGCTSTTTREVTIYPLPDVNFEEPSVTCEATAMNFIADVSPNVTDVLWDFGDPAGGAANVSERFDTYHAYEAPGSYTVTLTATSIYGCVNTFSRTITVAPNGLNGDIAVNPPSPICEGELTTLNAPPGGVSWEWSTGDTAGSIIVNEAGAYEVTVTDAEGCTYTPAAAVVDILPAPFASVYAVEYNDFQQPQAYFYGQYETCEGEDVFLEASEIPGYSYQWSNGDSGPETEFSEERGNLLGEGTHDVTLTLTDNSTGCTGEQTYTVIVHALPAAVQIEADQTGLLCEGNDVTLSVVNPDADLTYLWNTGQTGTAITTASAGDYSVRAINVNGCETESNTLTVETGPDLRKIPGGCHSRCRPDTLCLPALPDVVSYQWFFEGAPIPGPEGTVPDLIADESGEYYVELTNDQGCTLTSDPLNLDLFDGFGDIQGSVYFDVNENGEIDAADTLVSGIDILLSQNGAPQDTATSDSGGAYAFTGILATNYTLQIDPLSLPDGLAAYTSERDTAIMGCDDLVVVDWLLFLDCPTDTTEVNLAACPESTVDYNGTALNAGTTSLFIFNDVNGCDSLVAVTVDVLPTDTASLTLSACPGSSATYEGQELAGGSVTDFVFTNEAGCDSTVTVTVEILASDTTELELSACPGGSVLYNGVSLAAGTSDSFTFTNAAGCDSLVMVSVTELPADVNSLNLETCPGEPVTYAGQSLAPGVTRDFVFTNQQGCDSVVTVTVLAFPETEVNWETGAACPGLTDGALSITPAGGLLPFRYSLDGQSFTSQNDLTGLPPGSGSFWVEDAEGCRSEWTFTIAEKPPLLAVATDTLLPCADPRTTVRVELLSGDPATVSYRWEDGTEGPERTFTLPGLYPVAVSNECETLQLPVRVSREREVTGDLLYIPNAFSPNGDGINDTFLPLPGAEVQVETYQLSVFDRWGNQVFRSDNLNDGWDGRRNGTELDPGVYVWRMEARLLACGQAERVERYGDMVLLR